MNGSSVNVMLVSPVKDICMLIKVLLGTQKSAIKWPTLVFPAFNSAIIQLFLYFCLHFQVRPGKEKSKI